MTPAARVPLAPHTTFQVGGPADFFMRVRTHADLAAARMHARTHGLPLYTLGGGSNLLVSDEGVHATVAQIAFPGIVFRETSEGVFALAGAGVLFDRLVAEAARRGLWGIENLAGIPGTVGGAVVQNVGAYGTELAETFAYAEVDSGAGRRAFDRRDASFGYRRSAFKNDPDTVILRAAFLLQPRGRPNLAYADLARVAESGKELSTPHAVGEAVRAIRARKFPDLAREGTAGSFFKNPILSPRAAARLAARYADLPRYPQGDGSVKVPLAWLLDHALGMKGYAAGAARLFERQPLVLVAPRGALARDIETLARMVETRVHDALGIAIEREVESW